MDVLIAETQIHLSMGSDDLGPLCNFLTFMMSKVCSVSHSLLVFHHHCLSFELNWELLESLRLVRGLLEVAGPLSYTASSYDSLPFASLLNEVVVAVTE